MHTAAGTANKAGVLKLIELGADVNAKNDRGQAPFDCCAKANASIAKEIYKAGGRPSDTWDGKSGRSQDTNVRARNQTASLARQYRSEAWRENRSRG